MVTTPSAEPTPSYHQGHRLGSRQCGLLLSSRVLTGLAAFPLLYRSPICTEESAHVPSGARVKSPKDTGTKLGIAPNNGPACRRLPHGIPSLQAQLRVCVSEVPSCRHRQLTQPSLESTCHLLPEARPQASSSWGRASKGCICVRGARSFFSPPLPRGCPLKALRET